MNHRLYKNYVSVKCAEAHRRQYMINHMTHCKNTYTYTIWIISIHVLYLQITNWEKYINYFRSSSNPTFLIPESLKHAYSSFQTFLKTLTYRLSCNIWHPTVPWTILWGQIWIYRFFQYLVSSYKWNVIWITQSIRFLYRRPTLFN